MGMSISRLIISKATRLLRAAPLSLFISFLFAPSVVMAAASQEFPQIIGEEISLVSSGSIRTQPIEKAVNSVLVGSSSTQGSISPRELKAQAIDSLSTL